MNKKGYYIFYIYVVALALLTSCSDTWDDKYADTLFESFVGVSLAVDRESMEFSDAASSQQLNISATGYWTAKPSASWLHISSSSSRGNGTIDVTVDANTNTAQDRTGNIVVSNGMSSYTVSVVQHHLTEQLQVNRTELAYGFSGGADFVGVDVNAAWTVSSSAQWVTVSRNGEGTGFSVNVEQNISTSSRQATLTVKGVTLSATVVVNQTGVQAPAITNFVVVNITKHEATCNFYADSPNVEFNEYGVCYSSTNQTPSLTNAEVQKQTGGGWTVAYPFALNGLSSKTTYYVRPYITTVLGTQYGETTQFTTPVSAPNEGDNGTPQD